MEGRELGDREPACWAPHLTAVALEGSKTEEGAGGPGAAGSTLRKNLPLKMYKF